MKLRTDYVPPSQTLARAIQTAIGIETKVCVPGYIQRGGAPSAYDRLLSTQFGVGAAKLIREGHFGVTVALKNNEISYNNLEEIAFKTKTVPVPSPMIDAAADMGISFGI